MGADIFKFELAKKSARGYGLATKIANSCELSNNTFILPVKLLKELIKSEEDEDQKEILKNWLPNEEDEEDEEDEDDFIYVNIWC